MADQSPSKMTDEQVEVLLKEGGLEVDAMDPVSLRELRDFYSPKALSNRGDDSLSYSQSSEGCALPPPLGQIGSPRMTIIQRRISDITEAPGAPTTMTSLHRGDADSNGTTAGTSLTLEDRLMRRLDEQTKLIVDLHYRIDQLERTLEAGPGDRTRSRGMDPQTPRTPQFARAAQAAPMVPWTPPGQERQVRRPVAEPPQLMVLPLLTRFFNYVLDLPRHIRNSRLVRMLKLYLELRERQVPDFDAALFLKVLIMLMILMARFGSFDDDDEYEPIIDSPASFFRAYRLRLMLFLIIGGFLVQTGYAAFMYNFFVKEDYPGRIWNGEELTVEGVLAEAGQGNNDNRGGRPQPPAANRNNQNARNNQERNADDGDGGGWGHAILRGHIPRRDAPLARRRIPGPVRAVFESAVLIGSFFLSIFPMWTPQAAVEPPAVADQNREANGRENFDGHVDRNDNNQIPQVRAPDDPAEFEDDD